MDFLPSQTLSLEINSEQKSKMVRHNWRQIKVLSLYYTLVQSLLHHKWAEKFADWSSVRFWSRWRKKIDAPSFSHKSLQYSEAKSFTHWRNLPKKCQQLLPSAVFLFPYLPRRLQLAIIDLHCVKGHRIEDDSSRSNHGDSLSLCPWPSTVSVQG